MKKAIYFIAICISIIYTTSLFSQNCGYYIPLKPNTGTEMKSYDSNNKLTSTSKNTIISVTTEGEYTVANIKSEYIDELKGGKSSNEYKIKCNGSQFIIDTKSLLGSAMGAYKDMELKIESGEIEIPKNIAVGTKLKDSNLKMKAYTNGTLLSDMEYKYINRKVESKESITTPAGTFNCYKITYDLAMVSKVMTFTTNSTTKVVDYYAENIGVVKSQIFNDKGELLSYSILNRIY